eukprot:TRINITY_DN1983_c1_g1_i1.p1 TRINITY_DN1983_c1_g1~~TRINITY_DN1983_c1_g1_i1.p1  ORF type:complete len:606 (+),score=141.94 TRINITY_DN1983_c1_g1_i1:889-2706(+)
MRKCLVVLTARVHPSECGSSWIIKGVMDFLLNGSVMSHMLRDNFIFKIVPMINPDGVAEGNSRCSSQGLDLNRSWETPTPETCPTVFYAKKLMTELVNEGNPLVLYVDIHGHMRKRNVFLYGCEPAAGQLPQLQVTACDGAAAPAQAGLAPGWWCSRVFAKLLSFNTQSFSYDSCTWVVGRKKEGTARVAVWHELGVQNSFTLESSFCGPASGPQANTHFDVRSYRDIGVALCKSLYDYVSPDQTRVTYALQELLAEASLLTELNALGQQDDSGDARSNKLKKKKKKKKKKKTSRKADSKQHTPAKKPRPSSPHPEDASPAVPPRRHSAKAGRRTPQPVVGASTTPFSVASRSAKSSPGPYALHHRHPPSSSSSSSSSSSMATKKKKKKKKKKDGFGTLASKSLDNLRDVAREQKESRSLPSLRKPPAATAAPLHRPSHARPAVGRTFVALRPSVCGASYCNLAAAADSGGVGGCDCDCDCDCDGGDACDEPAPMPEVAEAAPLPLQSIPPPPPPPGHAPAASTLRQRRQRLCVPLQLTTALTPLPFTGDGTASEASAHHTPGFFPHLPPPKQCAPRYTMPHNSFMARYCTVPIPPLQQAALQNK